MLSYGPVTTGNRLVTRRTSLGLTQPEVAERLGTDQGTYSKWELGKSQPSKKFQPAVAEFLDISEADLRALIRSSKTSAGAGDLAQVDTALRDLIAGQDAQMRIMSRMNDGIDQMREAIDRLGEIVSGLAELVSRDLEGDG